MQSSWNNPHGSSQNFCAKNFELYVIRASILAIATTNIKNIASAPCATFFNQGPWLYVAQQQLYENSVALTQVKARWSWFLITSHLANQLPPLPFAYVWNVKHCTEKWKVNGRLLSQVSSLSLEPLCYFLLCISWLVCSCSGENLTLVHFNNYYLIRRQTDFLAPCCCLLLSLSR